MVSRKELAKMSNKGSTVSSEACEIGNESLSVKPDLVIHLDSHPKLVVTIFDFCKGYK